MVFPLYACASIMFLCVWISSFYRDTHQICCCLVAKSCLTLLQPCGLQPTRFLCPWGFPGKNTGVGCHFFLQEIFPNQGSNSYLLHCRQILYHWATWEAPQTGLVSTIMTTFKFNHLFKGPICKYSHSVVLGGGASSCGFGETPSAHNNDPVVRKALIEVRKYLCELRWCLGIRTNISSQYC